MGAAAIDRLRGTLFYRCQSGRCAPALCPISSFAKCEWRLGCGQIQRLRIRIGPINFRRVFRPPGIIGIVRFKHYGRVITIVAEVTIFQRGGVKKGLKVGAGQAL